jgi:uncharacterized protein with von Willebrand factor type A (vWA) domain
MDEPVRAGDPEALVRDVVGMARALRRHGVGASPDRVHAWLRAIDLLDPSVPLSVYRAGRATMCARPEELDIFDRLYGAPRPSPSDSGPDDTGADDVTSRVLVGGPEAGEIDGEDDEDSPDVLELPMASAVERLADRDLAELSEIDPALTRVLATVFANAGERRRAARYRVAKGGRPDRARTLRRIVATGGEISEIGYVHRQRRPRRLVLLVDISGSMAAYGEALLRFAHAAGRHRNPQTEVFTIGTRLTRVTPMLATPDADRAVRDAMGAVIDRGGGTRLGDLLKEFLDTWGQRGLARGAVVAVLSDGWERGDPAELGRQMARLARLAHRVVWANPHKAQPGFEPLAGGMAAALPYLDDFVEGHSLVALARLATTLLGMTGTETSDHGATRDWRTEGRDARAR